MAAPKQSWYKSVWFIGLVITLSGFGFFTLLFYWISKILVKA